MWRCARYPISKGDYCQSVVHVTCSYGYEKGNSKCQATGVSSGQEASKTASLSLTVMRVQLWKPRGALSPSLFASDKKKASESRKIVGELSENCQRVGELSENCRRIVGESENCRRIVGESENCRRVGELSESRRIVGKLSS